MPGYRDYQPINVHILSPAQLERREGKKASAAELKKSEASKRGKRSRRTGKKAEKDLFEDLKEDNLTVEQVAASGALAGKNLVGGAKTYDGDLHLTVGEERYLIESKYGKQVLFFANKAEELPATVGDKYTALNYVQFVMAARGLYEIETKTSIKDSNKKLHEFFEQDDADIVAMKPPLRDWLFVMKNEVVAKWNSISKSIASSAPPLPTCGTMTRQQRTKLQKGQSEPKPTTKKNWPKRPKSPAKPTTKRSVSHPASASRKVRRTSQKDSA